MGVMREVDWEDMMQISRKLNSGSSIQSNQLYQPSYVS